MFKNPFSLEGKSIFVTGASSGIGKEVAIQCSRLGARLVINGRNEKRLLETFRTLEGQDNLMVTADLTLHQSEIINSLPKLDGIVNAAGIINIQPFLFLSDEEMKTIFEINFFSPIRLTQQIINKKQLNKNSSIVFISSIEGNVVSSKGNSAYSASKSALTATVKTMALELANKKIRINSIQPGIIKTKLLEGLLENFTPEQLVEDEKKYPLGYGAPEDVAYAAIYLLSDASKWITGSSLVIDGGFSLQ
jgi:NAD(P)-dependent dehydrogenase (short-subunit alcohol dehydrogenase family)